MVSQIPAMLNTAEKANNLLTIFNSFWLESRSRQNAEPSKAMEIKCTSALALVVL